MKKKTVVFTATGFLLFLSACAGGEAEGAKALPGPQESVYTEENMETEAGQKAGAGAIPKEETKEPADKGGEPETTPVIYESGDRYLEISLPDTWEYRIKTVEDMEQEDDLMICAIDFWPEAYPEAVFKLGYCEMFGMCGTGVTTERMELSNGMTGYKYYERMEAENTLWLTIIFDQPDDGQKNGLYAIMASPELSAWEQTEPEFEEILDSVRVGPQTER